MIWSLSGLFTAVKSELSAQLKPIQTALAGLQAQGKQLMTDINKIQGDEAAELAAIDGLKTTVGSAVAAIQHGHHCRSIQDHRRLEGANCSGNPGYGRTA